MVDGRCAVTKWLLIEANVGIGWLIGDRKGLLSEDGDMKAWGGGRV